MALKFSNHNSVSNFWSIPMSWETCYPAMMNHLRLPVLQTRPEGYEVNIRLNEKNKTIYV